MNHRHPELLVACAQQLAATQKPVDGRDLSHTLSTLARMGVRPPGPTLEALERMVVAKLRAGRKQAQDAAAAAAGAAGAAGGGGLAPNVVCWCLWSLAKLGHRPRALLRALDEAWGHAPAQLYELGAEDAARMLSALAKLEHRSGTCRAGGGSVGLVGSKASAAHQLPTAQQA